MVFHRECVQGTVIWMKISCRSSGGIRRIADKTPLWACTNWCAWSSWCFAILSAPSSRTSWRRRDWASTADMTLRISIDSESEGGMFDWRRWGKGGSGRLIIEMPGKDRTRSLAARDIAFLVLRALFFIATAFFLTVATPSDAEYFVARTALLTLSHCN